MSTVTAQARPAVPTRVSAGSGSVRLTRRGRLLVTLAVLIALVSAVLAGAASVAAGTAELGRPTTVEVVVQPGQTLWGVATSVSPGGDPRDVVREIRELNGLEGSALLPGQALAVPVR